MVQLQIVGWRVSRGHSRAPEQSNNKKSLSRSSLGAGCVREKQELKRLSHASMRACLSRKTRIRVEWINFDDVKFHATLRY